MSRSLPPLQSLRYFEAAARLVSFKAAAGELHVTQGAVSQQIRSLEEFFGMRLFERLTRGVALTKAGLRLKSATDRALSEVNDAVLDIRSEVEKPVISVEVGPCFSARWLAPRLGNFYERHPNVRVNLHHSIGGLLPTGDIDIAILWGAGGWKANDVRHLLPITLQPVCAPHLLTGRFEIEQLGNLEKLPLLHARDREDWRSWLAHAGLPVEIAESGIVYDEPNVVIEAAVAGMGIALGYFSLYEADIASNRLVRADPRTAPSRRSYYCMRCSPDTRGGVATRDFYDWILTQAHQEARVGSLQ
jgi:LysR family glycine cleavage system transcriptional activator